MRAVSVRVIMCSKKAIVIELKIDGIGGAFPIAFRKNENETALLKACFGGDEESWDQVLIKDVAFDLFHEMSKRSEGDE